MQAAPGDRFVTIDIGATRLALPQGEVRAIDSALDLLAGDGGPSCGLVDTGAGTCPVYALDEALRIVPEVPPERRVCALFEHAGGRVGVLADAVGSVPASALRLEPLPIALRVPGSAVAGLAVHEAGLLFTTTAARLVEWLTTSVRAHGESRGAAA